jgi:hypothetical protein
MDCVSTRTPTIVEDTATLRGTPLLVAGLALTSLDQLPGYLTCHVRTTTDGSMNNSGLVSGTAPVRPLAFCTAVATSVHSTTHLRVGINPRG